VSAAVRQSPEYQPFLLEKGRLRQRLSVPIVSLRRGSYEISIPKPSGEFEAFKVERTLHDPNEFIGISLDDTRSQIQMHLSGQTFASAVTTPENSYRIQSYHLDQGRVYASFSAVASITNSISAIYQRAPGDDSFDLPPDALRPATEGDSSAPFIVSGVDDSISDGNQQVLINRSRRSVWITSAVTHSIWVECRGLTHKGISWANTSRLN
jgi:hypothetical protein